MHINTVWAAYFSATDTTKTVVTQVAQALSRRTGTPLQTFDFTPPQVRTPPKTFAPGDLVVFGTPVYAGRVPNLLIQYIASIRGQGALAVPIVCYGNRNYDDALMELHKTLEAGGLRTLAAGAFSCQHAFSQPQAAGRPDASDRTIASGLGSRSRLRQRPPGPLLHPPRPPRQPHQHPESHPPDQRRLYRMRPVRRGMSPGVHRPGGSQGHGGKMYEVQPLRPGLPGRGQVF